MSSCEDMLYPNLGYHCKGFGAADTKDEILVKSRNSRLCLAIQTMTHVQTSCLSPKQFTHFFIFNYYYHKISPSVTQKNTVFAMLNAGHLAHSTVSTASIHTPTISRHHFKSILSFKSPLVINYPGFPLAILDIPFTISPFEGQKMLFR